MSNGTEKLWVPIFFFRNMKHPQRHNLNLSILHKNKCTLASTFVSPPQPFKKQTSHMSTRKTKTKDFLTWFCLVLIQHPFRSVQISNLSRSYPWNKNTIITKENGGGEGKESDQITTDNQGEADTQAFWLNKCYLFYMPAFTTYDLVLWFHSDTFPATHNHSLE